MLKKRAAGEKRLKNEEARVSPVFFIFSFLREEKKNLALFLPSVPGFVMSDVVGEFSRAVSLDEPLERARWKERTEEKRAREEEKVSLHRFDAQSLTSEGKQKNSFQSPATSASSRSSTRARRASATVRSRTAWTTWATPTCGTGRGR